MAKLLAYTRGGGSDEVGGFMFWCPGCKEHHGFRTAQSIPNGREPVWTFNGDLEAPSFEPSLRVMAGPNRETTCHLFLRQGKLQFLNDCAHELAGQTVELPEEDDPNA